MKQSRTQHEKVEHVPSTLLTLNVEFRKCTPFFWATKLIFHYSRCALMKASLPLFPHTFDPVSVTIFKVFFFSHNLGVTWIMILLTWILNLCYFEFHQIKDFWWLDARWFRWRCSHTNPPIKFSFGTWDFHTFLVFLFFKLCSFYSSEWKSSNILVIISCHCYQKFFGMGWA